MGDLVNLRQVRKRKKRDEKAKTADQNRISHGRRRDERALSDAERQNAGKKLDGHQRTPEPAELDGKNETVDTETAKGKVAPETPVSPDESSDKSPDKSNVVSIFTQQHTND